MICPNCNKTIKNNSQFCNYCGRYFSKSSNDPDETKKATEEDLRQIHLQSKKKSMSYYIFEALQIFLVGVTIALLILEVVKISNLGYSSLDVIDMILPLLTLVPAILILKLIFAKRYTNDLVSYITIVLSGILFLIIFPSIAIKYFDNIK